MCSLKVKVAISRPTNSSFSFWAGVFDGFPSIERLCVQVIHTEFFRIDLVTLFRALQSSSHGVEERAAGVAKDHLELPRCPLLT